MISPTVDARCKCALCANRNGDTYVMTGKCSNCHQDGIEITFRAGDRARFVTCPTCKVDRAVMPVALAVTTTEETP